MQKTLRYMTKLDRAINNQEDLKSLNQFYRTVNISAKDLFQILKNVRYLFSKKFTNDLLFILIYFKDNSDL